jgi:hypothetical protein
MSMDESAQEAVAAAAEPACLVSDATESKALSFAWLEQRIEEFPDSKGEPVTTRFERYALAATVVIGGVTILAAVLLRNRVGLWAFWAGVALQWACVVAVYVSSGYRAWRSWNRQYRDYAGDLDNFYPTYRRVIDALQEFSATDIGRHLRYVRNRKAIFSYRFGMIIGGTEKLGFLPVLAVLYLQLKDWSFNGWADTLSHIHVIGSLLVLMLLITYLLALWAGRAKGRLDLYELLLAEAAESDEATVSQLR